MANLNAAQMFSAWRAGGGTDVGTAYIIALVIAFAESSWNTTAVSFTGDYGLWQINKIHFGNGIINSHNWSDPVVNARAAVAISGNGTNWAAWCTAWANPGPNCGHGHLSTYQNGSRAKTLEPRAMKLIGQAAGQIGLLPPGLSPTSAPAPHAGNGKVSAAWDDMNKYIHTVGPDQWNKIHAAISAIGKVAK